ncbi:MAG: RNA polymerase sigma factor [Deltaproteobacteria bacterium]|nr:RNA polymerase sigma factor [Deltaproteobacteria bacterium]
MTRGSSRPALAMLMRRYCDGDDEAFASMYPQLRRRLRCLLRPLCGNDAAIDDVIQDTLLRAHKARRRFEPRGRDPNLAVVAWYMRIARNVAYDHVRSEASNNRGPTVEREANEDPRPDPETALESRRQQQRAREAVDNALANLDHDQRALVRLTKLDDVRPCTLANEYGVSPGAMRVRVHRAFTAFRQALEAAS